MPASDPAEAPENVYADAAATLVRVEGLYPHYVSYMARDSAFRAAVDAAYRAGVAAGRKQAAADIRQKISDWRPQANTSLYALDVLSLAAEIAEGKTDG